ncbi:hypothetical protein AJ80_10021 [Polytolypa hystricis UAMH7299]|uniref:Uncharacterized protein n=1 Tax=Polytolypa hystricis (strain UAMH7299) TaxID=1447883 RepID=A0A2B7WF50_POLH7|nr:hypothetical protein AJ80_10021 [Polytolypa hystricis UAMH7299]
MDAPDVTLWRRNPLDSAKDTFSSWDKCMAKTYCKWPVIVGIIVGSLILIGILWCVIGCLCCGGGGRRDRSKYTEQPTSYDPNQNYGYAPSPAPPVYQPPSYAQFDVGRNGPGGAKPNNPDSLPAMPSWDNATTRRIEDTSPAAQDLEMNRLDPSTGQTMGTVSPRPTRGGYYEVPSQPTSPQYAPEGYRGTEPTTHFNRTPSPYAANPAVIGVAHSPGVALTNPTPYPVDTGATNMGFFPAPIAAPTHDTSRQYTRSPISPQPSYSPYPRNSQQPTPPPLQQQQQHSAYRPYSPSIPSSPPPPFSMAVGGDNHSPRASPPPTLLQAGRKPVGNSWRDV